MCGGGVFIHPSMGKPPWSWVLPPCDLPSVPVTLTFPGLVPQIKERWRASRAECHGFLFTGSNQEQSSGSHRSLSRAGAEGLRQHQRAIKTVRDHPAVQLLLPEAPSPVTWVPCPRPWGSARAVGIPSIVLWEQNK